MRCAEVAEFISASMDGEEMPREAREHMADCAACRERLQSYASISEALRRYGAEETAEPMPVRTWAEPQRRATGWWMKGWEMMRIPRIAFVALLLLLVAVGSRLALVEVRAHAEGSVLFLQLATGTGETFTCSLSTTDAKAQVCSGMSKVEGGWLTYGVQFLRKEGDRVLLGVVTGVGSRTTTYSPEEIKSLAKTETWFRPGETLPLGEAGGPKLTATGEWMDHLPALPLSKEVLDPGANELRVSSPLLLKTGKVAGDLQGATAICDRPGERVYLYLPGQGRFVFSLAPVEGAAVGAISFNRISFSAEGQSYVLVTGTPVARASQVWVTHDAAYKPDQPGLEGGFIGTM